MNNNVNNNEVIEENMRLNKKLENTIELYTTEYNSRKDLQKINDELKQKINNYIDKIQELRELVWMQDIPHPTVPEYRELHEKMQKILKFIDDRLLDKEYE